MQNTKTKGDVTEAVTLARLVAAGKTVLQPFGDNQRYDLAIDDDGKLVRVQCKTGQITKGVIRFRPCSSVTHTNKNVSHKSYRGEADVFAVFCPENEKLYLVPVEDVGTGTAALRIEPTQNGQSKNVRWASDYEMRM